MKKNILANIIGKLWGVLSGFLFIPLYIQFLGFESYAIISFTLIIAAIMAVLDAGLTATLSREFARIDQTIETKRKIFNTLESFYFIIVVLIGSVIFLTSDIIASNWLNLESADPKSVSLYIKIIGIEIGFQMLFRFYMGGMLGFERQVKANAIQVSWGILRNGLVVIAIYLYPTLEVFFIWQLIFTVLFSILMRFFLLKLLNGKYSFNFKPIIEKQVFLKIWKFAGGMLLISLVAAFNTQMDKLAISKLLTIDTLGYYTLAVSIAMGIVVLISPISVALLPRFTSLYSNGNDREAAQLYTKVNLFVAVLTFSFLGSMIFHSNDLIWIWTGNMELAKNADLFLPPIAVSFVMLALATIPYNIAIANGYTKLNNILGIISLLVTIPGYWIATSIYGGVGAAYVFCVVQITVTFIYLFFINKKFLNLSLMELFLNKLILPLIITILISYLFSFIPNIFEESRFLTLVLIGFITGSTLIISIFIFVPIKELKMMLKLKNK